MELKMTVDGLEKERDFYFGKLRDIEVMCQECDNSETPPIIQKILEVLYATEVTIAHYLHIKKYDFENQLKIYYLKSCIQLKNFYYNRFIIHIC